STGRVNNRWPRLSRRSRPDRPISTANCAAFAPTAPHRSAWSRTHRTPVTAALWSFSCSISSISMAKRSPQCRLRSGKNVFALCCQMQARRCTSVTTRSGAGRAFYDHARTLKVEGIVSKRVDAPYAPGNRGLWLKVKCVNREEFVVVGWTDPEGARPWLGALLLAYYDPDGRLIYVGRA